MLLWLIGFPINRENWIAPVYLGHNSAGFNPPALLSQPEAAAAASPTTCLYAKLCDRQWSISHQDLMQIFTLKVRKWKIHTHKHGTKLPTTKYKNRVVCCVIFLPPDVCVSCHMSLFERQSRTSLINIKRPTGNQSRGNEIHTYWPGLSSEWQKHFAIVTCIVMCWRTSHLLDNH